MVIGFDEGDEGEIWLVWLEEQGSKDRGLDLWFEWSWEEELDDIYIDGWWGIDVSDTCRSDWVNKSIKWKGGGE